MKSIVVHDAFVSWWPSPPLLKSRILSSLSRERHQQAHTSQDNQPTAMAAAAAVKTVLITGANRGIGLAFASHYSRLGWKVIASARSLDTADELKQLAPSQLLPLDTGDEQSILAAAEALKGEPIDLLINNAGVFEGGNLAASTKEDLMRNFEVNTVGPFLMTRAFLPHLRLAAQVRGAAFVAQVTSRMGSIADNTSGGSYGYRASKTALNMVAKSLAFDLKPDSVGCLLLHPGYVATRMVGHTGNVSPAQSVAGMAKIIEDATLEDSGKFFHFEGADSNASRQSPVTRPQKMMASPSAAELRDPTREELYAHGSRRALPAEIQQLGVEDTACTFCGVSYFVFAEVQELQATVKKYKRTFHTFVRFLERERRTSQDLKAEVRTLQTSFEQLAGAAAGGAAQLGAECAQLRAVDTAHCGALLAAHRELVQQQQVAQQLEAQLKRADDEWRLASALTEQKLRNEALHLSSQAEKCRLQSAAQEAERAAESERERAAIRALEARYAEGQAAWSLSERLAVSERDQLKQKLLAMTERVDEEQRAAKQLETQLRAAQQELKRVVSTSEAERAALSQLNSEVIVLKHQLHGFETSKALLLSERTQLHEAKMKSDALVPELLLQAGALQKRIAENAAATEKVKLEYMKELEKLRLEHATDIARLQRDHSAALAELKATQSEYVAFLKTETSAVQQGAELASHAAMDSEKKVGGLLGAWVGCLSDSGPSLRDAERQVSHWRDQAERCMEELQHVRLAEMQTRSLAGALEKKVVALEGDKRDATDESALLQRELEHQRTQAQQQLDKLQRDAEEHRRRLEAKSSALQTRVDQLELEKTQDATRADVAAQGPQVAWGEDRTRATVAGGDAVATASSAAKKPDARATAHTRGGTNGNQESHDLEKVIEKLRVDLSQKDRVRGDCVGGTFIITLCTADSACTDWGCCTPMNRRSRCYNRPFIASVLSARRC
ncbi:hypothetical protein PybrP1_004533 [[Pythium] brassicae (nom. inval.)]|nr:hypothetical protein PybrP1_004533 [[Pythium] brassicae (nom. inval.)]